MASIRDLFVTLGFDIDERPLERVDRNMRNIAVNARRLSIIFAGAAVSTGLFINEAAKFEQVEIAFETMLGSAEKAKEILDGLKDDARRTPFTLPGILDSAKRLLAMGIEADRLRDTIKILGDVSAGVGIDKLPNLTLALGQVSAATRLRGQEIRQFTEAGVPLLEELGKSLGKTAAEVQEMTSRGEVSFEDVRKALENMTLEGGRFFNLMERQSASLLGILSNLKDFLIINAIAIGKELLPQAKAITNELLAFLEVNRQIIKARLVKFFKGMGVVMGILFKVFKGTLEAILNVSDALGGLENVIKTVTFAMLTFIGLQILSGIGSVTQGIFAMVGAMKTLGTVALFTQAKLLAMPILIGAAVIALGLIIEDIIAFFRGKDSLTGVLVEAFEKKFPDAFINTKAALMAIRDTIGTIVDETKILLGFLNEFLITNPLTALGIISGPASAPANSSPGGGSSNNVRIENVNVPPLPAGTTAENVTDALADGFDRSLGGVLRQTHNATKPQVEF